MKTHDSLQICTFKFLNLNHTNVLTCACMQSLFPTHTHASLSGTCSVTAVADTHIHILSSKEWRFVSLWNSRGLLIHTVRAADCFFFFFSLNKIVFRASKVTTSKTPILCQIISRFCEPEPNRRLMQFCTCSCAEFMQNFALIWYLPAFVTVSVS